MSIQQAAAAAVSVFPATTVNTSRGRLPLRVVMVAISGAESGWTPTADGDCGLGGPSCGSCPGTGGLATSWGLWQIHNVHSAYLAQQTGSTSPCAWRSWLFTPHNNAQAALHIYQSQGLGAWGAYNDGSWASHISAAQSAVQAAMASPGPSEDVAQLGNSSGVAIPTPGSGIRGGVVIGLMLLGGGAAILAVDTDVHWAQIREWAARPISWGRMNTKGGLS